MLLAAAGVMALAWHPTIATIAPPRGFAPELVAQGAALAAIGDCAVCHTAPRGAPYAGGRPLSTPFGTIFSSNITPEPETGIGHWSLAAFSRAMRAGIDRAGALLYPAFPYDHFTHINDADMQALYAFIMTRAPVQSAPPANDLRFPANVRAFVGIWNLLFLSPGAWPVDPRHDAIWNRGAYLVEGLGHCGACHRPRNLLGGEEAASFAGGEVEGWWAPALGAGSPAPMPWTESQIYRYLRDGVDDRHGVAAGPMQAVVQALRAAPDADVVAMARYIASFYPSTPPEADLAHAKIALNPLGAVIFAGACAACHAPDAPMSLAGLASLADSTSLRAPGPQNAAHIIRNGLRPPAGQAGSMMPGFADLFSPDQLDALLDYLRARFAGAPPWKRLAAEEAR